jgi:hypothetical protein
MNQLTLIQEDTSDQQIVDRIDKKRRLAIKADVNAAGGQQKVGHDLGLDPDPEEAGKKLSNKLERNGRHDLKDSEVWRIREWARLRSGKSHLTELENQLLHYDGRWLTTADIKLLKRKRKAALLRELIELESEDE